MNLKGTNFNINVKKTWKYIKTSKKNLFGYGFVSVIEAIISAIIPLLSAKIILNITNGIIAQLILSSLSESLLHLVYLYYHA